MPEYLAPGVYVEEVSYRAKSIEGASTSIASCLGPTRYGPVGGEPELLTSFADFERIFGGIDNVGFEAAGGGIDFDQINYMAHSVRAFFDNGGTKLYVTRVHQAREGANAAETEALNGGRASTASADPAVTLQARFPGQAGNMRVVISVLATPNLLVPDTNASDPQVRGQVRGTREHDVLLVRDASSPLGPIEEGLYDVILLPDRTLGIRVGSPLEPTKLTYLDPAEVSVHRVVLNVRVTRLGRFEDEQVWTELPPHPDARNSMMEYFTMQPSSRLRYLTVPFAIVSEDDEILGSGARLVDALLGDGVINALNAAFDGSGPRPGDPDLEHEYHLTGGADGVLPNAESYRGQEATSADDVSTGLVTFEDIDEISMVAAPGHNAEGTDLLRSAQIVQSLITHCQILMRYRVAILDAPQNQIVSEVREYRSQFDSTHAALYYPWITTIDPLDPEGRREIELPPSGFVAGIYARTDVLHGVFKAPANEVVLGAIGFETLLNKRQQDVLNPEGINCFRFFEGRGYRLWGARTISSDPEWKYISVRRYFAYLEHSIDKGTQWAVFENNGDRLWANIRLTVEDFLFNEW
ncbi:MAG TPA: phage tail sheath subtilisin-like domain-containing protein, partial [Thermomicrobiales bacterium]|nr:phage tail sheath subtilisin-like domain-containing protein [Thermomicrobiales bacterium]